MIADRVKSVALGSVRANIADTIANQQQEIQQTPTKSDLKKAQEAATAWLTNGKGYAYFRKDDLGNIIDILFMDTQDPETAVNVMRVGQSGIGFSQSGVNGLYYSAWTIDGTFNADFIKAGSIESYDGALKINLSDGDFSFLASQGESPEKYAFDPFWGFVGYGYDNVTGELVRSLRITPGRRTQVGVRSSTMVSTFDDMPISIMGGSTSLGSSGTRTDIEGSPLRILYKSVSWKDNGDGTYTLIGK